MNYNFVRQAQALFYICENKYGPKSLKFFTVFEQNLSRILRRISDFHEHCREA